MQTAPRQMIRRFIGIVPGAVEVLKLGGAGTGMLRKKPVASSRRAWPLAVLVALATQAAAAAIHLSPVETRRIGNKIWQNECGGTISGLTAWNAGENFASLGIGHFIWYPKGVRGPFDESFPKFVAFATNRGTKLPSVASVQEGCPWKTRTEFIAAARSPAMKD